MKRILILLLSINLCCAIGWAQGASIPKNSEAKAQEMTLPEELPDSVKYRYPLFNGLSLSVNLFPPVMQVFGKDYCSYEAMITADIHHRFMPQVAAGIGSCNELSDNGYRYKSQMTPFFKVGMVYNFQFNEYKYGRDFYAAFIRYGYGYSKADITGLTYNDGFWNEYGPADIRDQKFHSHWLELGAMIKVEVVKHISLGWDISFKPFLSKGGNEYANPYYVPGYGATSSKIGMAFNLYWDIL